MTPNVFFLQLALFTMGNSADFVFPDQIEIVSESPPMLNVREAPFIISYENHQRSFSRDDSMQWDLDDGHQHRTQFTLRRAKPFGESKARKPLSIAGENKHQEMPGGLSSDDSANMLTTQASSHSCHHHQTQPSSSNSRPASSAPPPTKSTSQTSYYSNESHFRNDKDVIQSVKNTDSVNHNIAYYSPSKTYNAEISPSSSGEQGKFPYANPIPHVIRPMATLTNSVSDSQDTASSSSSFPRPVTSTNTGALNYRRQNRTSASYVSESFDQTHSTSVITAVGPKPAQLYSSNEPPPPPKSPQESQSSSSASSGVGSGLYFGSSETYSFRSSFAANNGPEDVSGDDFFLSFQDLVKCPLLGKLYNPDLYNTQYKTLFRSSSSSSSQSSSSGTSRSGSSFPRDFPVFSTFAQSSGPYLGSAAKGYFFKR